MDLQKYRTHDAAYGWRPAGMGAIASNGWRAFSKFRAILLWYSGVHLGMMLILSLRQFEVGGTGSGMIATIGGCVLGAGLALVAVNTSPKLDELTGEGNAE